MASIENLLRVDSHEETDEEGDVIVAKSVAMAVLFVICMIFGFLPMLLAKKFNWVGNGKNAADIKTSNRLVVALLSFGGGVLLCTTFLHLLPEVGENVAHLQEDEILPELPFSLESLLMCCGFFTMFLVEESVHLYMHSRAARTRPSRLTRTLSARHSRRQTPSAPPTISTADLLGQDPEKPKESTNNISTIMPAKQNGHGHSHSHSHLPIMEDEEDAVVSSLRGLLIVLALSVHELFEGLAVGLESSAKDVWYMLLAVSAHKLVIAFCVGVELVVAKTKPCLAGIYIITYAIVSPIGIGIGLALAGGSGAAASGLPSVILQGLASGTLLYVIFFEILDRDRSGFVQFFGALIGFLLMFGLKFIGGHEHDHGHGHGHNEGIEDSHAGHSHGR